MAERKGVLAVAYDGPDDWLNDEGILSREMVGEAEHLVLADGVDTQEILRRGVEAGARIRRFEIVEPRLHEIFVRHAGADLAEDAGTPLARVAGGVA